MKTNTRARHVLEKAHEMFVAGTRALSSYLTLPTKPKGVLVHSPKGVHWGDFQPDRPQPANADQNVQSRPLDSEQLLADPLLLREQPALVVSAKVRAAEDMSTWVEALGGEVATTSSISLALDSIAESTQSWGLLVVYADEIADIHEVVEALLLVRSVSSELPIILLSASFSGHEFGVERRAICDVSLKAPASFTSFRLAVSQAVSNNRLYNERVLA
ncbi:hypothetical protein [Falsiruegeria mediterranea]|uniref:Response regulatory domain-containing protein n=1 Tax=Falsiruegeria mediterranea M17 TaxID=1200281 RepID=A0A2R8C3S4_9RHOB|nr:hypothetical protein [Falsiruegeria mediterranea]SPJ27084.1 hypothetical protein TRM7615_00565 [Falsiruegeria mediterranea M17]